MKQFFFQHINTYTHEKQTHKKNKNKKQIHKHTHTHTHTHTHKHRYTHTNTCAHTHKHAHKQTHKHTYKQTHTHTHTPGLSFGSAFRQLAELFTELPNFSWRFGRAAEHPQSKSVPLIQYFNYERLGGRLIYNQHPRKIKPRRAAFNSTASFPSVTTVSTL